MLVVHHQHYCAPGKVMGLGLLPIQVWIGNQFIPELDSKRHYGLNQTAQFTPVFLSRLPARIS